MKNRTHFIAGTVTRQEIEEEVEAYAGSKKFGRMIKAITPVYSNGKLAEFQVPAFIWVT